MNATVGGLFDGIGLLAYGLHVAGWEHKWLCEVDPWRRELLNLRFPGVPVYDDVRAVDARAERPLLIAGGFREMARTIRELRPRYVLVENVANLLAIHDGAVWGEVVGDLAALGFDIEWDCFPAAAFGAPHLRDRVIAIATHADGADERGERGQWREQDGWTDAVGGADAPRVALSSAVVGMPRRSARGGCCDRAVVSMMPGVPVPDEREAERDVKGPFGPNTALGRAWHREGFNAGWGAATARSEAQVRALTLALTDLLEWAEHGEGFAPSGIRRTPAIAKARAALSVPVETVTVGSDEWRRRSRCDCRPGMDGGGVYHELDCASRTPIPVEGEADRCTCRWMWILRRSCTGQDVCPWSRADR